MPYEKKVVPDSPGLVDFAIGLVNPVLILPEGQVKFLGKFKLQKNCNQCCWSKKFLGYLKYSWASTYLQRLAQMASCKTIFLCTLWKATLKNLLETFAMSYKMWQNLYSTSNQMAKNRAASKTLSCKVNALSWWAGVSTARMVFGSIFLMLIEILSPQPLMKALKVSIRFFFRVNIILHYTLLK